ncbi:MAG: type II secretion system F family protein [Planctomycetaceae bacterium]
MPPPFPPLFAADAGALAVLQLVASLCFGGAAFVLARTIRNTLHSDDPEQDDEWRYDISRIAGLRRVSLFYRVFQPVIQGLAAVNRRAFRERLPELDREIQVSGLPRFWTAAEYLGRIQLIGLLAFPLLAWMCVRGMGPAGIVFALVASGVLMWFLRRRLSHRAETRLMLIKRRMPFLLDLLTLLMEAGSTFQRALSEAVTEFREHPVGMEFGRVLAEMNMGKSRSAALESMRTRLRDDEVTSIIGSIIQGENLGTPLARVFRTQADVLRIKRTQRAETVAGEAGVKMLLPAILVMAATVLIILGPFVLSFIHAPFF